MDRIGIVMVNYKDYAKRFLAECRDSLRNQSFPSNQFNVYIVDNASSEESLSLLAEMYKEAKVIPRVDGNYSAANNAGIRGAIEDGCNYIAIANMDTKFDPNWLLELYLAITSLPQAGIVQSKVLLYPKTVAEQKQLKVNSLGNSLHYLGFGFTNGYNQPDNTFVNQEIKGYCSGCSLIFRKELLDKIGAYNEEYYMYHDDIEFCWRAKLAGYKLYLAAKSIVYHKYEFSRSVQMLYYMERNRFIAIFSFYQRKTILLVVPILIFLDIGLWFYALLGGWIGTKFRVFLYFLQLDSWKKIRQTRRAVSELRTKSDSELLANLSGKIEFQEINNLILDKIANPILNIYFKFIRRIIVK